MRACSGASLGAASAPADTLSGADRSARVRSALRRSSNLCRACWGHRCLEGGNRETGLLWGRTAASSKALPPRLAAVPPAIAGPPLSAHSNPAAAWCVQASWVPRCAVPASLRRLLCARPPHPGELTCFGGCYVLLTNSLPDQPTACTWTGHGQRPSHLLCCRCCSGACCRPKPPTASC